MGGQHPATYRRSMFNWLERLPTRERDLRYHDGRRALVARRAPEPRPDNEIKRILSPRPGIAFMRLINIARGSRFQTDLPDAVNAAYRIVHKKISPGFTVQDANLTLSAEGIEIRVEG